MKRSTVILLLLTLQLPATRVMAQSLVYRWLNVPCQQNLNCNTGCSACNMPADGTSAFMGSAALWSGLDACPHPVSDGDNAVFTTGWSIEAEPMRFIGMNAATLQSLQVDSIIIRHRRSTDGPQRLRVTYSPDMFTAPTVLGETDVTEEFEETVYTELGCLSANENSSVAGLQLRLQAFQGGGGSLQVDEVRIIATPCNTLTVGIPDQVIRNGQAYNGQLVDALGRAVPAAPAPGVYIGERKRVVVL